MTPPRVTPTRSLTADDVRAVLAIVDSASEADGVAPLGEQFLLRVRAADTGVTHLLGHVEGRLAGYAQLDASDPAGTAAEVVVAPSARRRGVGTALVRRAEAGDPGVRVWAHGELPAATALAERLGYSRARSLWRMSRPLTAGEEFPSPRLPEGVTVRTFLPGQDEQQWLDVNSRAFATHPEQGRLTMADLLDRERSEWFAADGFFLAWRGDELVGFHWTKVEDAGSGEVYVLGVDPAEQGTGLGKALLLFGLRHLAGLRLREITLYVESDNEPAVALYHKLGFSRVNADAMFTPWHEP